MAARLTRHQKQRSSARIRPCAGTRTAADRDGLGHVMPARKTGVLGTRKPRIGRSRNCQGAFGSITWNSMSCGGQFRSLSAADRAKCADIAQDSETHGCGRAGNVVPLKIERS